MSKDPETFPMPADDLTFNPSYELYGLRPSEVFWRDRVPFLRAAGYSLRRRYQPHWYPNWPMQLQDMESIHHEDSWHNPTAMVIDAYRREDASLVAIICRSSASASVENELAILRFLSDEKLRRHPDNHCAPLLDVFHDSEAVNPLGGQGLTFLVTPWLYDFEQWPFETVDTALDFVHQTLEAIDFLHARGIAHRNCSSANIRVDASGLYSDIDRWPHPVRPSMDYSPPFGRLPPPNRQAVRYFLVGFEQASRMLDGHILFPVYDSDPRSINPELELTGVHFDNLYPPFGVDVCLLGNVYKHRLLETYLGLEMISGLVGAMTCSDPWGRPGIRRALTHFRRMYGQVPWYRLHWRLWRRAEASVIESVGRDVGHAASWTLGAVRSILNINV